MQAYRRRRARPPATASTEGSRGAAVIAILIEVVIPDFSNDVVEHLCELGLSFIPPAYQKPLPSATRLTWEIALGNTCNSVHEPCGPSAGSNICAPAYWSLRLLRVSPQHNKFVVEDQARWFPFGLRHVLQALPVQFVQWFCHCFDSQLLSCGNCRSMAAIMRWQRFSSIVRVCVPSQKM